MSYIDSINRLPRKEFTTVLGVDGELTPQQIRDASKRLTQSKMLFIKGLNPSKVSYRYLYH